MTIRNSALRTAVFAVLACGTSNVALAQSDRSAAAEADDGDIIVTARRTDEKLQDVPVAVAAFGADQLTEQRILSEADLQVATPGLVLRQTSSNNQINFALRGQAVDAFSGTAPAVVVYMNEVQVAGAGTQSFFDMQSIQVFKGPQGTLFGRNATGGAVLYQVVEPTHDFGGYLTAGYGNFNNIEINGALNVPIGTGAAVRVGASYRKRDGFQRNLALGGLESNQIDYQAYRASLLLDPIEGFKSVTTFQYNTDDGRASGLKLTSINVPGELGPDGTPLTAVTNFLYNLGVNGTPNAADLELARNQAAGFYDFYNSETNDHKSRQYFLSNKTSFELSDAVKLTNIFGYNNVRSNDIIDVDGAGLPWIIIGNVPDSQTAQPGAALPNAEGYHWYTKQWSNETQLSGQIMDDKLNYIVGVYFGDVKQGTNTPTCAFCDVPGVLVLGTPTTWGNQNRFNGERENKSKAVFAQFTYRLSDPLSFTAGYRHTWEDQSITREDDDPSTLLPSSQTKFASLKVNKPSWTLSLDYKVNDALLFYVAQRGSFRTAGYNIDNTIANITLPPVVDGGCTANGIEYRCQNNAYNTETTYDFEVGVKFAGDIGAMRSRINLALYNQEVKNIQRAVYLGIASVTGNVDKARIRGFELDANFTPSDNFEFGGGLAHTDAIYSDPDAVAGGRNFTYGPYGDAPKWTGSVFAKVSQDMGNTGNAYVRGEVYAQSSFYYSNLGNSFTPKTRIDGYALVNLRAGLDDIGGSAFSLMAYVQNLTKKKYYVGGLDLGAVIGTSARLVGTPRTYGLQGTFKF